MTFEIPIYSAEQQDGVAEEVRATSCIAYTAELKPAEFELSQEEIDLYKSQANIDRDTFDLYTLVSVLASTGWNLNSDIFLPEEIWAAKNSPVNKPFNDSHNDDKIIGHMTASQILDQTGKLVANDTPVDRLPQDLDIITTAVLYKIRTNPEVQERVNEIMAKCESSQGRVSMECLFRDFDYGLIDPAQGNKVVARNEETAFLTKHLRQYGGEGVYEGKKIGRVLRNFTFSANGFVENPANKRSIVFNGRKVEPFKTQSNKEELILSIGEKAMAEDTAKVVAELQKQLTEANERAVVKAEEAKEAAKAEFEAAKVVLQAQIDTLKSEAETFVERIERLKKEKEEQRSSSDTTVAELNEQKVDLSKQVAEMQEKVQALESEKVVASRMAKLIAAGMEEAEAEKTVELWKTASDEQFDQVVQLTQGEFMDKTGMTRREMVMSPTSLMTTASLDDIESEDTVTLTTADTDEKEESAFSQACASLFADAGDK